MVKSCLKNLNGKEKFSFTELLTALFEVENILTNCPLCFVYKDDMSDVLTRHCLLYRRNSHREKKLILE